MRSWKIRVAGLLLMIIGRFHFVCSVRDIQSECPQKFVLVISIFSTAMGFALSIMPLDITEDSED